MKTEQELKTLKARLQHERAKVFLNWILEDTNWILEDTSTNLPPLNEEPITSTQQQPQGGEEMAQKQCACLGELTKPQELTGMKGTFRWIDSGRIVGPGDGLDGGPFKPVLRAMKEGKDGRLFFTSHWIPVRFCPNCGAPVAVWHD